MENTDRTYKLTLSGGEVTVTDKEISQEVARRIIMLIMGGATSSSVEAQDVQVSTHDDNTSTEEEDTSSLTPKKFMAEKKPSSEIERVACLGYYLTFYCQTPVFKTKNITKLNREAAQPDFSNAAVFVRNATNAEYLAKAGGGSKQITHLGEAVVKALPDREEVKKAIEQNSSPRRRRASSKRTKKKK